MSSNRRAALMVLALLSLFFHAAVASAQSPLVFDWVETYDGGAGFDDLPLSAGVDTGGKFRVSGYAYGDYPNADGFGLLIGDIDAGVASPDVDELVVFSDTGADAAYGVASNGWVSAAFSMLLDGRFYVYAYFGDGDPDNWGTVFAGPPSGLAAAQALALPTSEQAIYATGFATGSDAEDVITAKYDDEGNELWSKVYNGAGDDEDRGLMIRNAPGGGVVVGGYATASDGDKDLLILRYASNGNILDEVVYNGGMDADFTLVFLDVAPDGTVYAGYNAFAAATLQGSGVVTVDDGGTVDEWSGGRPSLKMTAGCVGCDPFNPPADLAADGVSAVRLAYSGVLAKALADDILLTGSSLDGTELWSAEYAGPGAGADSALSIAGYGGLTAAAGFQKGAEGDTDAVALIVDHTDAAEGADLTPYLADVSGDLMGAADLAYDIALFANFTPGGALVVTTSHSGTSTGLDVGVLRYDVNLDPGPDDDDDDDDVSDDDAGDDDASDDDAGDDDAADDDASSDDDAAGDDDADSEDSGGCCG
ncbi:MAG: hypothetical protein M5R36_18580 [Deltaproteobacteria bacterium]|nr:hypothetical protein [Deltaproteobacteria bacterium]